MNKEITWALAFKMIAVLLLAGIIGVYFGDIAGKGTAIAGFLGIFATK